MPDFDEELSRLVRELNALGGSASLPAVERDASGRLRLDRLLSRALEAGASDLLLVSGAPATGRVDGSLLAVDPQVLDARTVRALVHEVLDERSARRLEERLSVDFSFDRPGLGRFRANVHHERGQVAVALRPLPAKAPEPSALGLPPVVERFAGLERGLVLFAGPAGSGKTTTLASLVGVMNRTRSLHIITIEDPVEYVHAHGTCLVEQIEVGHDVPSFADALRNAVRQDPDVIVVGEMRDPETMAMALSAAETGHLVLSSLHTGTVAQTLDRIVDSFADERQPQIRAQLSLTLAGIVIQHLVPRHAGRGRVAAVEVMVATDGVRNLLRRGLNHQLPAQMAMGRQAGSITLDEALARLVRSGAIAREQGLRRAAHPEEFEGFLR